MIEIGPGEFEIVASGEAVALFGSAAGAKRLAAVALALFSF